MAAKDQIELGLGENAAFLKLTAAIRHGIEAAVELSTYKSDPRWMGISILFEKMLTNVTAMHNNATKTIIQGFRQ